MPGLCLLLIGLAGTEGRCLRIKQPLSSRSGLPTISKWPYRQDDAEARPGGRVVNSSGGKKKGMSDVVELARGIEPPTGSLQNYCSAD